MDLSIQKMQPPASVQGKSAAKKTNQSESEEAVEDVTRDQKTRFTHGNTGYEAIDPDEQDNSQEETHQRKGRRKQRQLLSGEDLSHMTATMEEEGNQAHKAEDLMHLRAYKAPPKEEDEKSSPHFEVNI